MYSPLPVFFTMPLASEGEIPPFRYAPHGGAVGPVLCFYRQPTVWPLSVAVAESEISSKQND